MADADEGLLEIVADFLGRYTRDQREGVNRSLEAYQALYPGFEEAIAKEFHALLEITRPGGVTPPTWRSTDELGLASLNVESGLTAALELPRTLGPYRLEEELGRGGQGSVYRGVDTRSDEAVALKILHAGAAGSVQALMRFEREAALTARLADPGISNVRETGVLEGVPFIAMDFVAGGSLDTRLRSLRRGEAAEPGGGELRLGPPQPEGDPPEKRARARIVGILRFFEKLARTLHAAHELGIIHRDVKPGNIIDSPGHQPILLDFGLARQLEDEGVNLTLSGDLFGTPAYMSPEQVTRQAITLDRRTDVYSLGATLYECLTLHRPFEEATRDHLFQAIIAKPAPDPRQHDAAITAELKLVLDTALAKDRDHRYQTALDFAEDLRRVAESQPIRAQRPSPWARVRSWAKRNPAVAASLAAVLLILSAALVVTLGALKAEKEQRQRAEDAAHQIRIQAAAGTLDYLFRRDDDLWPAFPEKAPAMEEWLDQARILAREIPPFRHELEQERASSTVVRSLLTHLSANEDALRVRIARMEVRLEQARTLQARTIEECHEAWETAAEELSSDRRFDGFALEPIRGLIPLGANPRTRLQEFGAYLSGSTIPERDPRHGRHRITTTDVVVLVLVPGGSCSLGSPPEEIGRGTNEAQAARNLDPFLIGKFEVTQDQFTRIMGSNPSELRVGRPGLTQPITGLHPVETVDWKEARTFALRLDLELPTEAQWERACRAETTTAHPWGDAVGALKEKENLADESFRQMLRMGTDTERFVGWDDGFPYHAPVGSFQPNPWGLHDIMGNVQEWCRDPYHDFLDRVEATGPDGCSPPRSGDPEDMRVYRGAAWQSPGIEARAAWRYGRPNHRRANTIGIRLSRRARP